MVVIAAIFAKYIKAPTLINHWETYMLLGSSLTFFYVSGMGYTLVSFVKKHNISSWPSIFRNSFQLLFMLSCLSFFGIVCIGHFNPMYSYPLTDLCAFGIYSIAMVCSTILEYMYFINRAYKKLLLWGFVNFIAFVSCATLPLIFGLPFRYSILALAIYGTIKLTYTLLHIDNPFTLKQNNFFKPLIRFNWPIVSSLLLGTGYIYLASFILKVHVSDQAFNVFRYGSREFPLFLVMANALSIVLGGLTAEKYNKTDYWMTLKKSHRRLLHQLMPIACFLMLSSSYLFEILFSKSFIPSFIIFNILNLTLLARVLFPQSLLLGLGKNRYFFYSSLFECGVGILLVMLLIPNYGIQGVAYGLSIAFFAEKSLLIYYCYRQGIPFHKSLDLGWYIFYSILLLSCFIWSLNL